MSSQTLSMIRAIVITVFLQSVSFFVISQDTLQVKESIFTGGGGTQNGRYLYGEVGKTFGPKILVSGGFLFEKGTLPETEYNSAILFTGIHYIPLSFSSNFWFKFGGGIVGKYDKVTSFEGTIDDSYLNPGGFIGTELGISLSKKLILTLEGKQLLYPFSKFDTQAYFIGGGLRIHFKSKKDAIEEDL